MHVLLLCWAGDHLGQSACVQFWNQGKSGCRRCKIVGKLTVQTHMYYGKTATTIDILGKRDLLNLLLRICLT